MAERQGESVMEMLAAPQGLLLVAWMAQAGAATLLCWWYLHLLGRPQPRPATLPPALVLVPLRGPLPDLDAFLSALGSQAYEGAWRVVLALEHAGDPACAAAACFVAAHPERAAIVLADAAVTRGQKVQNLLAALDALRPDDAVVVTLDADIIPPPDLLARLLRPVLSGQAPIASGYRWTLPADDASGSALVALAEMGIATLPRCARCNLCWGGATAIRRDALDLPRVWDRAVSDDLMLTRAARAAGLLIYAPLDVRPPAPAGFATLGNALRFGARQYRVLRLHAPRAFALALAAAALPVAGGVAVLLAMPTPVSLACLLAMLALQRLRARLRRR
ncbi:MAG: glycosyltransferase family 2 protein, partial [Acetobacteraceae bacterium]|nr:glycosyltransferase family 2 protein [Acetobacteraceae bacterium]